MKIDRKLRDHYFQIDPRSLAVFRILLGASLFEDVARRWMDRSAFFYRDAMFAPGTVSAYFTPFNWLPTNGWIDLYFLATLLALLAFTVGYRTRLTQLLSYALHLSLLLRDDLLNNAGDTIASLFLVWTWFLPLGARWSFDACVRKVPTSLISPLGAFAVYLQIAGIYLASAISKFGYQWTDGTALYYFWNLTFGGTRGFTLAHQLPSDWIKIFSYTSLMTEWLTPILVLAPPSRFPLRRYACLGLVMMHLGIHFTFHTGAFQFISVACALLLISSEDWDAMLKYLPKAIRRPLENAPSPSLRPAPALLRCIAQTGLAVLILASLLYGAADSLNTRLGIPLLAELASAEGSIFGQFNLTQAWRMYAPHPGDFTRWWVFEGETPDGQRVDLLTGQRPDYSRPCDLGGRQSRFWTRLMVPLPFNPSRYRGVARYWARQNPGLPLRRFRMIYLDQKVSAPGQEVFFMPRVYTLFEYDLDTEALRTMTSDKVLRWDYQEWKPQ